MSVDSDNKQDLRISLPLAGCAWRSIAVPADEHIDEMVVR
jgi:hypothetical protein